MNIIEFKTVAEVGILIIIAVTYIQQQKKLFNQFEQQTQLLSKLEKTINGGFLSGANLELIIKLKNKEIVNNLRLKIVKYIRENNLKSNWDYIAIELYNYIDHLLYNFDEDIKSKIEANIYLKLKDNLKDNIESTMGGIYKDIEELKNKTDAKDKDYNNTIRKIKAKLDKLENILNKNF